MTYIPEKHRGIPWSKEDIKIVVRMYDSGSKISEIAERTDRSTNSIQGKLKTLGIRRLRKDFWNELEINRLFNLRKQGKSFKEIGLILNKTERATQGKHMRLVNPVKPKKNHKKKNNNNYRRIYSAKDDYFSIIDTQKKSYYIGFILADGYVTTEVNTKGKRYKLNRLGMKLSEKDIDVLYDLKNELCSQVPIHISKPRTIKFRGRIINSNTSCYIHVTSEQIVKDLAIYGIVQNKTYICGFPDRLESGYYPGFIAGILSGDGYVGTRTCHNNPAVILRSSFAGTKLLLDGIRNILINNVGFNPQKKPRKHNQCKSLYTLELNKTETLNMYHWMKKYGASLMPRKNKIIEDYINHYPEKCSLQARSA